MPLHDLRQVGIAASSLWRDQVSRRRFGHCAPRVSELIWVNPQKIHAYLDRLPKGITSRTASACVFDFAAEGLRYTRLMDLPQVRSSFQHWCDGVPWEKTEDFAHSLRRVQLLRLGFRRRSKATILRRYRQLDAVFEQISRERSFRTQKELKPWNFREFGGVQVSIDASGQLALVRASGLHRISIAKILGLHCIPAQIGLVDIRAISYLDALRRPLPELEPVDGASLPRASA